MAKLLDDLIMDNQTKAQDSFSVLQLKFPSGVPDIRKLTEEQKAWLQLTFQKITDIKGLQLARNLQKIHNRLVHAEEDISDKELQKMASFIFENIEKIKKLSTK